MHAGVPSQSGSGTAGVTGRAGGCLIALPKKSRTAGFPQYGFKASLSGRAFYVVILAHMCFDALVFAAG